MHNYNLSNLMQLLVQEQKKFKVQTTYPYSRLLEDNLDLLSSLGYILGYTTFSIKQKRLFKIYLKYTPRGKALINSVKFFTTPSRKLTLTKYVLKRFCYMYQTSLFVLTTSGGLKGVSNIMFTNENSPSGILLYQLD